MVKAPPALTSITIFEMLHGFENAAVLAGDMSQRMARDRDYARSLVRECMPFNEEAAEIAAYIFPRLSQKARNKLWRDMFIAATALAHEHAVATRNRRDYELLANHTPPSYPPLRIEVWKT